MTELRAERYQRLKQILQKALVLPVEFREQYVRDAAGNDVKLRDELLAMLAEEQEDFLITHSDRFSEEVQKTVPTVESVGPFKIIEKIGEGGMGVVFRAAQNEPVKREVALKMLHLSHHKGLRSRFLKECQALARLSHTNVAALYSADISEDGHPYAVMELVDGSPITEYCDQHKLAIKDRIQLFCRVCDGVAHAHERNILHCDLKPNNVLVTSLQGRPVAKVIDFGLARALESDPDLARTTRGIALGSPAYLSPERISAADDWQPDPRTDVYALGLLLHELLVGVHPFYDGKMSMALLVATQLREDPQRPSDKWRKMSVDQRLEQAALRRTGETEVRRKLRGDLDAIVLKSLARHPDERYGTPASLAADLKRYLSNRPVEARPASNRYVIGRFLRRNWIAVGFASTVLVLLLAGIITTTQQAKRANLEAERAQAAASEATEVTNFLIDLFNTADPVELANEDLSVIDLLDQASERIDTEFEQQPLNKGRLMSTFGGIYQRLGRNEQAEYLLESALVHLESSEGEDKTRLVINTLDSLSIHYRQQDRLDESEAIAKRSVEWSRRQPDELLRARSLNTLANLYFSRRQWEQAQPLYEEILDIRQRILGPENLETVLANNNIGSVLLMQRKVDEAAVYYRRMLQMVEQELPSGHPWRTVALRNLGSVASRKRDYETALGYYQRTLSEQVEKMADTHPDVLITFRYIAGELQRMGRFEESRAHLQHVLNASIDQYGRKHRRVADVLMLLALNFQVEGQHEKSLNHYRQGFEIRAQVLGPSDPATMFAQHRVVEQLLPLGRVDEARNILTEMLNNPALETNEEAAAAVQRNLAAADRLQGDYSAAESRLRTLIDERRPEDPNVDWNAGYYELGLALIAQQRFEEAETQLRVAIEGWQARLSERDFRVADSHYAIGQTFEARQLFEEAEQAYRKALSIREQVFPENHLAISEAKAALESLNARLASP